MSKSSKLPSKYKNGRFLTFEQIERIKADAFIAGRDYARDDVMRKIDRHFSPRANDAHC